MDKDLKDSLPCFSTVVQQDSSRLYGVQNTLPIYLRKKVILAKQETVVETNLNFQRSAQFLVFRHFQNSKLEPALRRQMKPDVAELYEGKSISFLLDCLSQSVSMSEDDDIRSRRTEILSVRQKLLNGFGVGSVIAPTGFWTKLELDQKFAEDAEEAFQKYVNDFSPKAYKFPKKHFSSNAERFIMLEKIAPLVDTGKWVEIDILQCRSPPITLFPVWQKESVRPCSDYRGQNEVSFATERMRLLGSRSTHELQELCLSPDFSVRRTLQFKRDIVEDIFVERSFLLQVQEDKKTAATAGSQKIDHSLDSEMKSIYKDENEWAISFQPHSAGRDLKGFYPQCAAACKFLNVQLVPLPIPDGQTATPWKLFASKSCVFGSLSSVMDCCQISEILALCLVVLGHVLCTIYIDDIGSVSREGCSEFYNSI
jgi:hypothetical protein